MEKKETEKIDRALIFAVDYDEEARTLDVVFESEEAQRYENVPPETYEALEKAEDEAAFVHEHIVGKFPCRPISERPPAETDQGGEAFERDDEPEA